MEHVGDSAGLARRLGLPGAGSAGADGTARWVAVAAVVLVTGVNLLGITRTVQATVAIVVPVVVILAVVIVAGLLSPVRDAVAVLFGADWIWLAVLGAALAALGSMLNLVAGISRTGLAMAREGDLPRPLAAVSARTSVPWVAQLAAAGVVVVLVLTVDVVTVVGFSSFGVLVYYGVANLAAFTLTERVVRAPRWLNLAGALLCLVLALTLPWVSVLVMLGVFAVGLAGRALVMGRRGPRD